MTDRWSKGGVRCRYCGSSTDSVARKNPAAWPKLRVCNSCGKILWPDGTPKNPVEGRLVPPSRDFTAEMTRWMLENGKTSL